MDRAATCLALAAAVALASATARAGDGGLSVDWLAHGQYVLLAGDGRQLLEDEGNLMASGFVLDRLVLEKGFAKGPVLGVGLGLLVPDRPEHVEASVTAGLRQPGRWLVWADVHRHVSAFDDSIGPISSTEGLYPSHGLGMDVFGRRDGLVLGVTLTPCTCSSIRIRVERSCMFGQMVPLKGSEADGYVFEYPSLWDMKRSRAAVLVDALVVRGALSLDLGLSYRFVKVGDALTAWRRPAFDLADVLERERMVHAVTLRLGGGIEIAPPLEVRGGYVFGVRFMQPGRARDAFGDAWRIEYGKGGGYGVFTHSVPLGILLTPLAGLDLRLRFVGSYSYGKTERPATAYVGEPGTVIRSSSLEAGVDARSFVESLEISFTRLRWLDARLAQRLEFENRDLFRAVFDTLEGDGVDASVAEDVALRSLSTRLEALLRFRIVKGLVLSATVRYDHVLSDEVVEELVGWTPHGDSRLWNLTARLELRYRPGSKLTLWLQAGLVEGRRSRLRADVLDVTRLTVLGGVRASPTGWLGLYGIYSYTHGDTEVGPMPILGDWDTRIYRGRIHAAQAGLILSPLPWLCIDAGYQLALVTGSLESAIHRMGAEARFKVWKDVRVGAGYLGRILDDGPAWDDGYSGHAIRVMVSGSF